MKPVEVFYGLKEGEERPLNLQLILENRNRLFDEVVEKITKYQNQTIGSHNKNRFVEPTFQENQSLYNKKQGIKSKKKPKYRIVKLKQDRRKTFTDYRDIVIHKTKLKRARRI